MQILNINSKTNILKTTVYDVKECLDTGHKCRRDGLTKMKETSWGWAVPSSGSAGVN